MEYITFLLMKYPLYEIVFQKSYSKQSNTDAGEGNMQNCQEEMQLMTATESQENAVMAQLLLSSIGYVANGGLGLLVIGGIVSFRFFSFFFSAE